MLTLHPGGSIGVGYLTNTPIAPTAKLDINGDISIAGTDNANNPKKARLYVAGDCAGAIVLNDAGTVKVCLQYQ